MVHNRRRQLNLIKIGTILVGLAGSGAIGSSRITLAQSTDLPPPPPVSVPADLPPVAPPEALPPVNLTPTPGRSLVAPTNSKGYRVYVNGDSALLLQQVRTIEPTAFVQTYQGRRVIQVGLFSDEGNAQQKVARLAAQGVQSELTNELVGSALTTSPAAQGYYVVIPANQADLPQVREQAMRLGVPAHLLSLRDRPLGTHVAIGPFIQKKDAEEVDQYLSQGGLNTRVFFDR